MRSKLISFIQFKIKMKTSDPTNHTTLPAWDFFLGFSFAVVKITRIHAFKYTIVSDQDQTVLI